MRAKKPSRVNFASIFSQKKTLLNNFSVCALVFVVIKAVSAAAEFLESTNKTKNQQFSFSSDAPHRHPPKTHTVQFMTHKSSCCCSTETSMLLLFQATFRPLPKHTLTSRRFFAAVEEETLLFILRKSNKKPKQRFVVYSHSSKFSRSSCWCIEKIHSSSFAASSLSHSFVFIARTARKLTSKLTRTTTKTMDIWTHSSLRVSLIYCITKENKLKIITKLSLSGSTHRELSSFYAIFTSSSCSLICCSSKEWNLLLLSRQH